MNIFNNLDSSKQPRKEDKPNSKQFRDISLHDNDFFIPTKIREASRGKLKELKIGNKTVDTPSSNQHGKHKVQSVVPFIAKSFATGQLQTGREYISLIDETDTSHVLFTTTITTITTTS